MTSSIATKPVFSDAAGMKWIDPFPGERIAIRVGADQTGGRFSIAEGIIQPLVGPPLHIHRDADEVLYVLEGVVDMECGGRRVRSGPGGLVVVPRGMPHSFRNFGAGPARLLAILLPGGFEQIFQAMNGRPLDDFPQVAKEFSLEIVGPPLEPAD